MSEDNQETGLEIAVIGMSGRFPGADDIEQYWDQLLNRHHSISVFSEGELRAQGIPEEHIRHPDYVKAKPFLDRIYDFDAALFGYAPWEAENMDPQIRVFHECVYHALEHAGYHPDRYGGKIGMYAGASLDMEWMRTSLALHDSGSLDILESGVISYKDFLSQLISYKLNLTGPSYTLYTACSTSLAAIHLACQGLLLGDCNLAVAGGVTLEQPSKSGYLYQEGRIESRDGVCRPFDSRADGTVFGDGAGAVVLKRLSDAVQDGDYIYAVIKASASNNDGRRKVGFAAPSLEGQKEVIQSALELADIPPETIGYVETHGTGTHVGDPMEFEGLKQIFGPKREAPIPIGSVKGNIGHLHAAAGVAGFIKAALALNRETIPPTAHFSSPNPLLKMEQSPFYVNTEPVAWKRGPRPRRAGVSSFGVGGTNVHLILEEAPLLPSSTPSVGPAVLTFSAKSAASLERMLKEMAQHLDDHPGANLADTAYTLQTGRGQFKYKAACVAERAEDAVRILSGEAAGLYREAEERTRRPVVFMFTGQGSQWPGMGAELYRTHDKFRLETDRLCERLLPKLGVDLRHYMCLTREGPALQGQREATALDETWLAQPALFVLEYALAQTWMDLGVQPAHMAGHSIGEYVAATLAGVFTLEDALDVVVARGRLMQAAPGGIMLAAAVTESEAGQYVSESVSLAAVNEPGMVVLSGEEADLLRLKEMWDREGVFNKRLQTSHAFHSSQMDPVLEPFREVLRGKTLHAPTLPFYSCLTGELITAEMAVDPGYWVSQLRGTVSFSSIISGCLRNKDYVYLEVGPGMTLTHFVLAQAQESALALPSLTAPSRSVGDGSIFLNTLSRLWLAGVRVDWRALYKGQARRKTPLPLYPFDRQTYLPNAGNGAGMVPKRPEEEPRRGGQGGEAGQAGKEGQGRQDGQRGQDRQDRQGEGEQGKHDRQNGQRGKDEQGLLYLPSWKPRPLPAAGNEGTGDPGHCWLILLDRDSAADRCAAQLERQGERCIKVLSSDRYQVVGGDVYALNPACPGDYRELAAGLAAEGITVDRILHAWCLADDGPSAMEEARGYLSLINLVAALEKEVLDKDIRLTVAADGVFDLYGDGSFNPQQRSLLAPVLTIPQEYPQIQCRLLDFQMADKDRLAGRLMQELISNATEKVTLYRGNSRLVQAFEPVLDSQAEDGSECCDPAREVYLVVCGEGGGGRITQFLEAKGTGRVFRTEGITSGEISQAIRAAADLRGVIDGVFYVPDLSGHELRRLPELAAAEQLPIIADGDFDLLNRLLRDSGAKIGFGWIESSLSSVAGGFGFTWLAARAGSYDAAAEQAAASGIPWLSLAWDFIRSGSGGENVPGIPEDRVPGLYERLWPLRDRASRVLISALPPGERFLSAGRAQDHVTAIAPPKNSGTSGYRERPSSLGSLVPPATEAENILCEIAGEQLGVHPVGLHDNFFDLGGHSLMLTRLLSRIKDVFRAEVPLKAVFDNPSVEGIMDSLAGHWGSRDTLEAIAASYREYQQLIYEEMKG